MPLVRSLTADISGRYDDYSDFGSTSNPKFGVNWEVLDGFKLRASYARSFVAPALTSIGSDGQGTTSETSFLSTTPMGTSAFAFAAAMAKANLPCFGF